MTTPRPPSRAGGRVALLVGALIGGALLLPGADREVLVAQGVGRRLAADLEALEAARPPAGASLFAAGRR